MAAGVRVVLVEPQGGANVGSACRAIRNMGGGTLAVVRPAFDCEQARRMAVHAADLLENRLETDTVADALEGCGLVVGTTARVGPWRERVEDVRDIAPELSRRLIDGQASPAILFGREDTGLTNEDIARCHRLLTIPSSEEYASLNLAQAVLLVLWEVRRAGLDAAAGLAETRAVEPAVVSSVAGSAATLLDDAGEAGEAGDAREAGDVGPAMVSRHVASVQPADAAQVEAMFEQLQDSLVEIGFLSEREPGRVMASVRSLLSRTGLDARELSILRGIARQIRWYAKGGVDVVRRKREDGDLLR